VALQNGGLTDGLGEMTLARAAGTEKQGILVVVDEREFPARVRDCG
jgi:hypothetical protein